MQIAVGSDEKNALTDFVISYLKKHQYKFTLFGALASHKTNKKICTDWPIVSQQVAKEVVSQKAQQGILFCWTGTGASIAANKIEGARAALCQDAEIAQGAKIWNDANILVMSLAKTDPKQAEVILKAWFGSKFKNDEWNKLQLSRVEPKSRCGWVDLNNPLYVQYHDEEWGKPVYDDNKHFEMLTLEGAQAGLSWQTILKKRENYRKAFLYFDPKKIVRFSKAKIEKLLLDPGLVRNRLKIESTVSNAKAFLKIQKEFGSFNDYIWGFVDNKAMRNNFANLKAIPTHTPLSDYISRDLKKKGFRFVGTTIIYAYMQAVGLVDDHTLDCFCRN